MLDGDTLVNGDNSEEITGEYRDKLKHEEDKKGMNLLETMLSEFLDRNMVSEISVEEFARL
jgi:hypothetical protein